MSQDIVADVMNQIVNAKKARKKSVNVKRHSKFLLTILAIGKLKGYVKDFQVKGNDLEIEFGDKLNMCKAVKPRYVVKNRDLEKYVKRYLPARDMGILIISTNNGLVTHQTAIDQNLGGSVVAYFY